ncbi:CBO0543 family protein [Neobacillus drentensis]|uniref:CBO0543 family protein n=1 Tax=Neobacillus drentensis TaxID=220684 RepID=UPI002FFE5B90
MSIDWVTIVLMWVIGMISYIVVTQKKRHRKVLFTILVCQAILWLNAFIHVEFHLIAYPVRELPIATNVLFTTEYFFYPLVCGVYLAYEPKRRSYWVRLFYLSVWISALTVYDLILAKFTNLIEYLHYAWYFTWLNYFLIFVVTNGIFQWFFHEKRYFQKDQEAAK